MDQLWGVLGRAYIDTAFRNGLITAALADTPGATEPEKDVSKLVSLDTFLSAQGFRASRFDRGEIHRVSFIVDGLKNEVKDEDNPLRAMVGLSAVATATLAPGTIVPSARPIELWSLIGLCAIDTVVRESYTAPNADVGVLVGSSPRFYLETEDIAFARALFASPDCKTALATFEENCWIPPKNPAEVLTELSEQLATIAQDIRDGKPLPKVQCSTGYTREVPAPPPGMEKKETYKHLAAPLADSLTAAAVALQPARLS